MRLAFLGIASCAILLAGYPPSQAESPTQRPSIRFPQSTVVVPTPPPTPTDVSKLTLETLYVIESDAPCILIASPAGIVRISTDQGPIKIRGRFIDGSGKPETRTYSAQTIFTVEAVAKGRVELLVIPGTVTGEADIARRTIDVDAGHAPQPPPDIEPEPDEPPVPEPITGFRAILLHETTQNHTREQIGAIYSTSVRKYLTEFATKADDGRPAWRIWDKDTDVSNESPQWKEMMETALADTAPLPKLVIFNGTKGTVYPVQSEDQLLKILKGGN